MRELTDLKAQSGTWRDLERKAHDAAGLLEMAIEENQTDMAEEVAHDLPQIEAAVGTASSSTCSFPVSTIMQ